MNVERFARERSPDWERLEALLRRARGRADRLEPAAVLELGRLYRAAAADLALARRRYPSDPVRARLEALVRSARAVVYGGAQRRTSLRAFLTRGYWRRVAERPRLLAAAAVLLLVPALLGALWGLSDPAAAIGVVPEQFRPAADPSATDEGFSRAEQGAFSVAVLVNNIQVTFLAFAGGIAAGAVTALVMAFNGLLLGAVIGIATGAGRGPEVVEVVAAHGVLELSCIVVAGAAGLRMGWAIVEPGVRTRGRALRAEALAAVEIILGTAPWLVLAGFVEGFVARAGAGLGAGLAVGIGLGALYWGLVVWRGRPNAVEHGGGERSAAALTAAPAPSP